MKENLRFYLKINCLARKGWVKVTYGYGGRVQVSAYQEVGGGEKNLDLHSAVFYCFGSLFTLTCIVQCFTVLDPSSYSQLAWGTSCIPVSDSDKRSWMS